MILDLLALTLFMLEYIFILGSYPFENLIFHIERWNASKNHLLLYNLINLLLRK